MYEKKIVSFAITYKKHDYLKLFFFTGVLNMLKEKIFLMLSDIDNTITPTSDEARVEFAQFAKKMKDENNVSLKFCPISGRAPEHVSLVMKELNKPFEAVGLPETVVLGAADQGGVYAYRGDSKRNRPIAKVDEVLRKDISEAVFSSSVSEYFYEETGTKAINVFQVKSEYVAGLSKERAEEFFREKLDYLKIYMEKLFGKKIHLSRFANNEVGVLEIVPHGVGKDVAIKKLFEKFQKNYDIVGMCYCGDHENDLKAIDYMSRLAEVPGIKTHIFLPKNAQECTKNPEIKVWQDKIGDKSQGRVIRQGNFDTLKGVLDAMKGEYYKGNLIGQGMSRKFSVDDTYTTVQNSRLLEKLNKTISEKKSYNSVLEK